MLKIFITIYLFLLCPSLLMGELLEVKELEKYETDKFLHYSLAKTPDESIDQLSKKKWHRDKQSFHTPKYKNSAYWVKIQIKNSNNIPKKYYLKADNQFTYKIDFYLLRAGTLLSHIEDGVISKNPNRAFNTNHMIFPVAMEANSTVDVYFKIRNYNKINIHFDLVTEAYLLDYYQSYNMLEGIFFGGMLLMLLYNLFLYFLLGIPAYLYYVGYVFWLSVYFIGLFGFSQRYFEDYPYLFYLSSGTFFIFLTLFVQSILNLKKKLPLIYKTLNLFILYFIVSTLINVYVLEAHLFNYAQLLFNAFFTLIVVFVITIVGSTYYLAYFQKDSIARFYSMVWSFIATIGLLIPLQYLNVISIEFPPDYLFQLLILLEILFFSFILAYKINLIEKEKKEQEHILVQQSKLTSMGEAITMIAHQWRQPLSEINGIVLNMDIDFQKKQLSKRQFNNYLDSVENITAHMSETINNFLDYFKHNQKKEKFRLSELLKGTLNLVSATNKKNIPITYVEAPEVILNSYRSELVQVLLIVINNAIDACVQNKEVNNPEIVITTEKTAKHLIISIEDNGGGISAEIIDKIYNPYFTTKHEYQGTGLGLYILKIIMEQTIQGKVAIHSHNETTKCKLYIP